LKYYKTTDKLFSVNRLCFDFLKIEILVSLAFKQEISKLFANHLAEKKYYEEAGMILLRANLLDEALDMFYKSLNWQMYVNVCIKLNLQKSAFIDKLNAMIGKFFFRNFGI
jgi:hypothetical protein